MAEIARIEILYLVLGIVLTLSGGFGLYRRFKYLFGPEFYDVREDITDSEFGCCFISTYMIAALAVPAAWIAIGVYIFEVATEGIIHESHEASDYKWVWYWIWIVLGCTVFYCCCVTPFASCIFCCFFIGDEPEPPKKGADVEDPDVADGGDDEMGGPEDNGELDEDPQERRRRHRVDKMVRPNGPMSMLFDGFGSLMPAKWQAAAADAIGNQGAERMTGLRKGLLSEPAAE